MLIACPRAIPPSDPNAAVAGYGDFARVDTDPRREPDAMPPLEPIVQRVERFLHVQCREHGA
jgi:hypothetical protein